VSDLFSLLLFTMLSFILACWNIRVGYGISACVRKQGHLGRSLDLVRQCLHVNVQTFDLSNDFNIDISRTLEARFTADHFLASASSHQIKASISSLAEMVVPHQNTQNSLLKTYLLMMSSLC